MNDDDVSLIVFEVIWIVGALGHITLSVFRRSLGDGE